MLRMQTNDGWWLITHPDHARLAGAFATAWGNEIFCQPKPRARVLHAIASHDDGWAVRDQSPSITREGKPSAFSAELVGKYAAFEEIALQEYLAVRARAVRIIAEDDPYAGLLIAMHTHSLLTDHADRLTIQPDQLPLLDHFLDEQQAYQLHLRTRISEDETLTPSEKSEDAIRENFRLLQACDNLSLLTCVAFAEQAHLLHPLPLVDGSAAEVTVEPVGERHFRLQPWPFLAGELRFELPARHVAGYTFSTSKELATLFHAAPVASLSVTLSS
uniref:DUF3891 domain-containing protein n=1 Tax=mine drainage metagenome TaxID=410659 RepID=E6QJ10_9ZZZZ